MEQKDQQHEVDSSTHSDRSNTAPASELANITMPVLNNLVDHFKTLYGNDFAKMPHRSDTLFVIVQHGFVSIKPMMDALLGFGISPEQVFLTTKPHTTPETMWDYFKGKFDDHYVPFCWDLPADYNPASGKHPYRVLSEKTCDNLLDKIIHFLFHDKKCDRFKNMVVCDEGGRFLSKLIERYNQQSDNISEMLRAMNIVAVEHTRCGRRDDQLFNLPFPYINMAESFPKIALEAQLIANSMFRALGQKFREMISKQKDPCIGVIGCGAVGEQVIGYLLEHYPQVRLIAYDKVAGKVVGIKRRHAVDTRWERLENKEDLKGLLKDATIVLGCSGCDVLKGLSISEITSDKPETHLISCSSGINEFESFLVSNNVSFSELSHIEDLMFPVGQDPSLVIHNAGFPVNFSLREDAGLLIEEAQLPRTLKLAAIVQALVLLQYLPSLRCHPEPKAWLEGYVKLAWQLEITHWYAERLPENVSYTKQGLLALTQEDINERSENIGVHMPTLAQIQEAYFAYLKRDSASSDEKILGSALNKVMQSFHVQLSEQQQELAYYLPTEVMEHVPSHISVAEYVVELEEKKKRGEALPDAFSLDTTMNGFLEGNKKLLLLLGEPGSGKSLFAWSQTQKLYQTKIHDVKGCRWLPIVIDLKHYRLSQLSNLLSCYLRQGRSCAHLSNESQGLGLSEEELTALQGECAKECGHRLLVILDGFDELRQEVASDQADIERAFRDCVKTCLQGYGQVSWHSDQVKFVVTCRSRHLTDLATEKRYFSDGDDQIYERRVLLPFNQGQVTQYIEQYLQNNEKSQHPVTCLTLDDYDAVLAQSPEVKSLVSNPFILKLFVQALPELQQTGNNLKKIKRYDIYEAFVRQWFHRETLRLPKEAQREIGLSSTAPDVVTAAQTTFEEYAAILANELYRQDSLVVSLSLHQQKPAVQIWLDLKRRVLKGLDGVVKNELTQRYQKLIEDPFEQETLEEDEINSLEDYLARYHNEERKKIKIITAKSLEAFKITSPLKQQGDACSFIHKSFYEYFLAQAIIQSAGSEENLEERVTDTLLVLSSHEQHPDRRIHHEPQVLKFLEDIWIGQSTTPRIERLKETFFEVIERSKGHPEHGAAAANAITILNWMQTMLMYESWQGINIPGANLSYAVLDGTDLQGANISGARLFRAQLSNVNLSHARLPNVAFLERAPIKLNQGGYVAAIVYHPHQSWLAIAIGKIVRQYDTENGTWVGQSLQGHDGSVTSVAYAPDGKMLVSGSRDMTVRQWIAATGEPFGLVLHGHTSPVHCVAYAPDGRTLASGGTADKTVRQWSATTGELFGPVLGHTDWITSVTYAPDGRTLASGSGDGTVRQWMVATGGPFGPVLQHNQRVTSVAYAPDSKTLASGSLDETVRQWVVATGEPFGPVLKGHTDAVMSVTYAPDGKTLASSSHDSTVRQWVVATGEPLGPALQGYRGIVVSMAYASDVHILVSCGWGKTVRQWLATTGELFGPVLQGYNGRVTSVAYAPDGEVLASGSLRWLAATGELFGPVLQGYNGRVTSVAYAPDGRTLASGSGDGTVRQWVVATGGSSGPVLQGHTKYVTSLAYAPDGRILASGGYDNTVRQWVAATGELFGPVLGHTDCITSVTYAPDGRALASGSGDGAVRQWVVATGRPFGPVLQGHDGSVTSVAYAPDGRILASGGYDNTVRQWVAATGELFGPVLGHTNWITSVTYAPDGRTLASGSGDGTVRQWVVATGGPFGPALQGHAKSVTSVAYAPNGLYLASAGHDHRICVWHSGKHGDFSLLWRTCSAMTELQAAGLRLRGALGLTQEQLALLQYAGCEETTETVPVVSKHSAGFFNPTVTNFPTDSEFRYRHPDLSALF